MNKIVFQNLGISNINSLASKFDELKLVVSEIYDILIITETRLDNTLPTSQFCIEGFSMPYTLDRNRNGVGISIYVSEDITTKILRKNNLPEEIGRILLETNFRKSKWLLCGIYHLPSQNDQYFFDNIDKALDMYYSYEKIVLAGDFNAQEGKRLLDTFLYQHKLHSINKNPICYTNPNNPSNINLVPTYCSKNFFKTDTIFPGLSDFHRLVLSVFKTTFTKSKPK